MYNELSALLDGGGTRWSDRASVLVLHDRGRVEQVEALWQSLPELRGDSQVTVATTDATGQPPIAALAPSGRFDTVIDLTAAPGQRTRVKTLIPLVGAGGCILSARGEKPDGADIFLHRLTEVNESRATLATVLGAATATENWIKVEVIGDSMVKVFENEIDDFDAARRARGAGEAPDPTVVHPARAWTSRGVVHGNDEARAAALPTSFAGSELRLHTYDDAWCLWQAAVVADGVCLPDSFRRSYADTFSNAQLQSLSPRAVLPPDRPRRRLSGTFLHLDNEWRGNFGHNLLEQISKTWAWTEAASQHPDVRALVTARRHMPVAEWEYELLEAAGVPRERVVVAEEPVEVERLITATGAYQLPDRTHPHLVTLYAQMADRLWTPPASGAYPERVFFSRKQGMRRGCLNGRSVEAVMREYGFDVIYPEDHPLDVQMSIVQACTTFAGYAGSGMYHLALTAGGPAKQVVAITASTYNEVVESVFASLYGHELWMIWCENVESRATKLVQSDYWFDAADEDYLRSSLSQLDAPSARSPRG